MYRAFKIMNTIIGLQSIKNTTYGRSVNGSFMNGKERVPTIEEVRYNPLITGSLRRDEYFLATEYVLLRRLASGAAMMWQRTPVMMHCRI